MKRFKLGRRPVQWRKRLHLAKYLNRSVVKLPTTTPLDLTSPLVNSGMLANGPDPLNPPEIPNGVGCCFWAASLRAAVARKNSAGASMDLTQPWAVASVLAAYSGCTGFNLNDAINTDIGTDPDQGFLYLQTFGIALQDGSFDKLGPVVAVNPRDFEEVLIAHNLFGGLYVGVQFPPSWEDADVWDAVTEQPEGGHEIETLSDASVTPEGVKIDTWGSLRLITPAGLSQFCDQLTATVDPGFFGPSGTAINGFDATQLQADLQEISPVTIL